LSNSLRPLDNRIFFAAGNGAIRLSWYRAASCLFRFDFCWTGHGLGSLCTLFFLRDRFFNGFCLGGSRNGRGGGRFFGRLDSICRCRLFAGVVQVLQRCPLRIRDGINNQKNAHEKQQGEGKVSLHKRQVWGLRIIFLIEKT